MSIFITKMVSPIDCKCTSEMCVEKQMYQVDESMHAW